MTIQQLVENKTTLDYKELCGTLINIFCAGETMNWESILPAQQQQEYFGGETLRLIADHPILSKQKDIRPIALKRGSISQMLFFYVTLKEENLNKKNIQDVTKKFISGGDANRYIIWFFGNAKNTELKVVLSAKEGKKVVLKTLPFAAEQPYYKTYNFILNEVSQKVSQLFVEPTDLWKALWKAFDISIVNRNFYNEIKAAFDSLIQTELPKAPQLFKTEEIKVQFAIRLIGRLIFCWFLKRKGIIKDEVLSSIAFDKNVEGYYHELLEVLFFDVFNKPVKERSKKIPTSIKDYPFLNGGLFEDQPTDFKDNFQLQISNKWFSNFFGNTLEKYNFTVDENSSSNSEIAIDPEMLGRIFENLLAEQNTETKTLASDRKSTGSFYTPREIVDYMVETSIVEYLQNFYSSNYHTLLQKWVHDNELPTELKDKAAELLEKLNTIKVLDPACGSGAFPMGVLQKLTTLKHGIDKKKELYDIKLETIENSIYGIDIQPMATELSRLRCWLSLIVDEDINKVKALPNLDFKFITANSLIDFGYDTFLKKLQKEGALLAQPFIDKLNELKKIRADFFDVSTENKQKENLKKKFVQIQKELLYQSNELAKSNYSINQFADKIITWNPFDDSKIAPFFSKSWMFGVEDGFDVVIGNPPYIKEPTNRNAFDGLRDSPYYQGKMDLWYFFACRFLDNLKRNTGVLTFIATNNWVTNAGASKFRNKIVNDAQLMQLVDFTNYKIFESADIQTMIMLFKQTSQLPEYEFDYRKITDTQITIDDVIEILNRGENKKFQYLNPDFNRSYFSDKTFVFSNENDSLILNSILNEGEFFINGDTELMSGIDVLQDAVNKQSQKKLGDKFKVGDGIFVLSNEEKDELNFSKKELELIKPYFTTKELQRIYGNNKNSFWIIYTNSSFKNPDNIKPYPNIKKHLDQFEKVITSENGIYGLNRPREESFFQGEKILSVRKCATPAFTYTDFDSYVSRAFFSIKTNRINQKYLSAVLNSKVVAFWLKHKGKMQGFQYQVDKDPIINIPIAIAKDTSIFESMVDYIIFLKGNTTVNINEYVSNDHLVQSFEEVINACVYELYFEQHMKEKQIDVLRFAKDLIKPIGEAKDKATVINEVYSKLKEPSNEIRNRMLLFATRSETTLLPIQKVY